MIHRILAAVGLSVLPLAAAAAASEPQADQTAPNAAALRQSWRAAAQQYRVALKANPNDAVAHNLLGTCLQRLGQDKSARKEYERAIRLDPAYAQAHNNLATVFHTQGKYGQAVEHYRAALARNAGLAVTHRNLGTALLAMGKTEEGVAALSEAQRLDPSILDTADSGGIAVHSAALAEQYFCFAKLSARAGQIDAALDFLRKARSAGFTDFAKVRSDPDFRSVVPDQRFAVLTH